MLLDPIKNKQTNNNPDTHPIIMDPNNRYPQYNNPQPSLPGESIYALRSAQAYGQPVVQEGNLQSPPPQPQQYPVSQYNPNQSYTPQQQQPQHQHQHVGSGGTRPISASNTANQYTMQASQQNLEASIHRMQQSSHIMRGAMDADDLPTTLDRAATMLGELGDPKDRHRHKHHSHGHTSSSNPHSSNTASMSPKHYYEVHMLAIEELPNIEEYFLSLSSGPYARYTMKSLYEITQYTSRAVPRLYLQICAGSALIRSGEDSPTNVLNDLIQAVKCVQCPIRGLFLRDYLLKAVRDKLPDEAEMKDDRSLIQQEGGENEDIGHDSGGASGGFDEVKLHNEYSDAAEQQRAPNPSLTHLMGDLTMNMNTNTNTNMNMNNSATVFTDDIPPSLNNEAKQHFDESVIGSSTNTTSTPTNSHVKDSYQFVLANFIEMNKLWVRIQHLPGDAKNKDTKRRRERERNELRMMVGTNLVRLSELEGVTSAIYGTVVLPRILDQIVACRDPLAQAYLMDCIIQVFPDEFHIQTLEVVLNVCPKLRDKVNIRTILQSIMDRLSNYYADELLLNDEEDTEGVKTSVMLDSFEMFDECIRSVFDARGAKLNAKEVIRLESSLLDFSLKCYPGRMDHINRCLGVCASCLRGEGTSIGAITSDANPISSIPIDEVATQELENLLSLPLQTMGLNVLDLDQYSELLSILPFLQRKRVGIELLSVLYSSGGKMTEMREIEQLFAILDPLIRSESKNDESLDALREKESIAKLIHLLYNEDTDIHFDILSFVKKYLFSSGSGLKIDSYTVSPLFYSTMKLLERVQNLEFPSAKEEVIEDEEISEELKDDQEKEVEEEQKCKSEGICEEEENAQPSDDEAFKEEDKEFDNTTDGNDTEIQTGDDDIYDSQDIDATEETDATAIVDVAEPVADIDAAPEITGESNESVDESSEVNETSQLAEAVDFGATSIELEQSTTVETTNADGGLNEKNQEIQSINNPNFAEVGGLFTESVETSAHEFTKSTK